jgi:uncharacterized membrane protein
MPNSRKWIIGGLVLSVTVNLLLAGFVAGRLLEPRMGPPHMDPTLALFPALRELPDTRRAELRPLVREEFRKARPEMRRMMKAQRAINAALTAEPFSADALTAALTDFRSALLASQEGSHAALVRLAQELTPAERQLLVTSMRHGHRPPFGPGPGGGRMRQPPPEPTEP